MDIECTEDTYIKRLSTSQYRLDSRTNDVVQVEIHLIQRLLHVLNMLDRHLDEIVSMAEETAELADVLRRAKRRRQ